MQTIRARTRQIIQRVARLRAVPMSWNANWHHSSAAGGGDGYLSWVDVKTREILWPLLEQVG
jgi:hypothetical protein